MKVVCVETLVQVTFGIMDDDGDIVEKHPVTFTVPKLTPDNLAVLLQNTDETKQKLQKSVNEAQTKGSDTQDEEKVCRKKSSSKPRPSPE